MLGTRSIKTTSKAWAIDTAISMVDLTTLEGSDTPGKVRSLAAKARRPDPGDPTTPQVAAVCVYGDLAGVAREALGRQRHPRRRRRHRVPERPRQPRGQARRREGRRRQRRRRDRHGHRPRRLPRRPLPRRLRRDRRRQGGLRTSAHLKVILETGELVTLDNVRRASWLAMLAGGDFIKTSTGKISPAATLPVCLVMLEAVRDFRAATGTQIGVKPAGGIRTTKDAIKHLVLVNETAGAGLAHPRLVPLRRLQPAQRPAAAAAEAPHRPLLRPRLRDDRLRPTA